MDGGQSERRSLGRGRLLAIAIAIGVAIAALAVVLPDDLRVLVIVVAFAAGIGLERHRHSFFPAPPSLRETPESWKYVLRYEVGYGQIAIATALLGAAAAILVISFDSGEDAPPPVASAPALGRSRSGPRGARREIRE